ncbi:hypothetical protein H5410_035804 [Solanum commersonii]|uniref:Uncharacterized protein n=1 Tax=Solanum commersonii TaxID=4109 RepID=A0A9J5Y5S8_SOLCO|nr:hypothetical protein H5410_035804 [Solanum commersonii]
MWWVLSGVGRVRHSSSAIENQPKNLGRKQWSGMVGNGLSVSMNLGIWATNTSIRGKDVKFSARILNEFFGTPNCDSDDFNTLKDKLPYRDIRHTLCGVESTARAQGIEDEAVVLTIAFHPDLMGKLVDMTQTKALDTSHGPVLSAQERQARDDNIMARMFGMLELQL